MPQLANDEVTQMFTIPGEDWKAINKRVGIVNRLKLVEQSIKPYLPAFQEVQGDCFTWQTNVFPGMISQSAAIVEYSQKAINDFTLLLAMVKLLDRNQPVPLPVQLLTSVTLKTLENNTRPLADNCMVISMLLMKFATDNTLIDMQMEKNKEKMGIFWTPIGEAIAAVEKGAGRITSVWSAIKDDLRNAISNPVAITMPYIESLNIGIAIKSWEKLKAEASAFPAKVDGQFKYWFNPFED